MIPLQQSPTHARRVLLGFAMILAAILYVDRVCIAQSQHLIGVDLGLPKKQMGLALTVFGIAYGLFEIPGGWLADRFGPRRVLTTGVCWWSFFTAASGQWHVVIVVIAGWYAVGALCWLGLDPVTPVAAPEEMAKDQDEFPTSRIPASEA